MVMRLGYMGRFSFLSRPRVAWCSVHGCGDGGTPCIRIAGFKSPSILEIERQYLMEPDGLRHGEVSTVVASSRRFRERNECELPNRNGSRSLSRRLSRRDNKNDKGNPQ